MMNIIQTNHRDTNPLPTSSSHCRYYLFCSAAVTTVAATVTCCYCYLLCPASAATTIATAVTCYCCYLLLLLLLLFLATAATHYTTATCYNSDSLGVDGKRQFPSTGNLAPLIQSLEIVCRVNRSFLTPLLSHYFDVTTFLADTNLSGVVESDTFSWP